MEYEFIHPGDVTISVAVGARKVDLPVRVVKSPVNPGDPSEKVIETLGLPNQKTAVFVSWPTTESYDGFIYSPTPIESSISASHWRYDKYPGLVISIRDGSVHEINSYRIKPEPNDVTRNATALGEIRVWTSKSGRFTTEAMFVRYNRGIVTLMNDKGQTKDLRLVDLSAGDRAYVRKQIRAAGANR